jgi:prepilin-type N-terminal cleavage/methylation domain-containing protein
MFLRTSHHKLYKKKAHQKGFTLIELMVSIAIFSLITTMAVFSNTQFNASVLLTNLAYEVAISIRQAQVYGVTVRKNTANAFDSAYGVHFDLATPASYLLYEDTNGNRIYDTGTDIALETFNIQKGNGIRQICVTKNSVLTCNNTSGSTLDVSFIRPNPEASIVFNAVTQDKAEICVSSPQNTKRKIVVEETGQIWVSTDLGTACSL